MTTAFHAASWRVPKSSPAPPRSACVPAVKCQQQTLQRSVCICTASSSDSQSLRRDGAPSTLRAAGRARAGASTSGQGLPAPAGISDVLYSEGEFVELGYVVAAHGIKGEVKVHITTDSPKKRFGKTGTKLYLKPPVPKGLLAAAQEEETPLVELTTNGFKVQNAGDGKEIWILQFKEIDDRTEAEKLRSHVIVLPCAHREALRDPDEFYAQDLIGCHVFDQVDGVYVGQVVELFTGFGTAETLQLKLRLTKEDMAKSRVRTCMVPFIKAMVPLVDKKAKRILVSLPEGLLELCTTKKTRPLDGERRAMKLEEIRNLEEQERHCRLLDPVVLPPAASAGTGTQAQSELVKEMQSKEDTQDEDEEDEEEAPEEKPKPAPARRFRARRPPLSRRVSRPAATTTP